MDLTQGIANAARAASHRPWAVAAGVVIVGFAVWALGTRTQEHHLRVTLEDAVSIAKGLDVQMNGVDIGKVSDVGLADGRAVIELGINAEAWPLKRGTRAGIRFGTTIGNGTRRIEVWPARNGPDLPEGGLIPLKDTTVPVEFDEVFNTLTPETRSDLQRGQQRLSRAISGRGEEIGRGIESGSKALEAAGGLLRELASDDRAMREMISHTSAVTRTLAVRKARISGLMTAASLTFSTFAANTRKIQASLDRVPVTLRETRTTLGRLEPTVDRLDQLMDDVAPGAKALRPLAASARPALADLRSLIPQALGTVRTARAAAPEISKLLLDGTPLVEDLTSVLGDLAPAVGCLRPYAPELAGFLSNWSSFSKNEDRYSSYARVRAVVGETALNDAPEMKTSDLVKTTNITYAGLRPPGLNAGEPWFMPECGVGEDVLDPSKDWEDTP